MRADAICSLLMTTWFSTQVISPACGKRETAPPPQLPAPSVSATASVSFVRDRGNPLLIPELVPSAAESRYPFISDPTLLYEGGKFKMWFAYGGLDRAWDDESVRVRVAYGESDTGLVWQIIAPVLDVGTGWDRTNVETPSVVADPQLPSLHPRKYRLYYAGLDRALEKLPIERILQIGMIYGIGVAFSADGRRFTKLPAAESPYGVEGLVLRPNPPVADRDMFDLINVSDPHVLIKDGEYHLWYTSHGREASTNKTFFTVAYATSADGIRWVKQGPVVKGEAAWERARADVSVGRPTVFWTGRRFEMFYDAVKADDNPQMNTAAGVGFAWSVDGQRWQKDPGPVFIANGGRGEAKGIVIGAGVLRKDDTYYLYYPGADPDWNRWTLNLATARVPF